MERRFGNGSWGKSLSEIKRKCNQKCIDKANKCKHEDSELIEKKVHVSVDNDDDEIKEIEEE